MNTRWIRRTAVGLALLTSLAGATVASAQGYDQRSQRNDQRNWNANAGLTGVWQLANRDNQPGGGGYDRNPSWRSDPQSSNDGRRGGFGDRMGVLPPTIHIEQSGRTLRIENAAGQLLRQTSVRGNRQRMAQVKIDTTVRGGTRISELYVLQAGGRRLEVHTTVTGSRGSRGSQSFTSVYNRG